MGKVCIGLSDQGVFLGLWPHVISNKGDEIIQIINLVDILVSFHDPTKGHGKNKRVVGFFPVHVVSGKDKKFFVEFFHHVHGVKQHLRPFNGLAAEIGSADGGDKDHVTADHVCIIDNKAGRAWCVAGGKEDFDDGAALTEGMGFTVLQGNVVIF